MIQEILKEPNEKLHISAELVNSDEIKSSKIQQLIKDMIETMQEAKGVGLAATQIGVAKRIIIVQRKDKPIALFNPLIYRASRDTFISQEGCLSVPNVYGLVKRSSEVRVRGFDINGKQIHLKARGLEAAIFQHEIDHIDGKLFIDKALKVYNEKTSSGDLF